MEAQNQLHAALRQYCHNNGEGLLHGYDKKETDKIVSNLLVKNEILTNALQTVMGELAQWNLTEGDPEAIAAMKVGRDALAR